MHRSQQVIGRIAAHLLDARLVEAQGVAQLRGCGPDGHIDVAASGESVNRESAYDTQRLKNEYNYLRGTEFAGKAVVLGALSLYLEFINLFQFIADDVQQIIHRYFLGLHDPVLRVVIGQHLDRQPPAAATLDRERATHKLAEEFYRRLLSTSFLVAPLDNYVASVLEALHATQDQLPAQLVSRTMAFDASTLSSPVDEPTPALDNQVFLGAKGYFLKRMRSFGFPVPPGFILTTELFRLRDALDSYPQLRQEVLKLIDQLVQAPEIATGKRLGDPERPLLLSVRSGASS